MTWNNKGRCLCREAPMLSAQLLSQFEVVASTVQRSTNQNNTGGLRLERLKA